MWKIYESIIDYVPVNEQEMKDKEKILEYFRYSNNILDRDNVLWHLTSSAFVVNESMTHTLMVYHNIFGGFIYPGGHADGNANLLEVAIRETMEETGVIASPINEDIFGIQINTVKGHVKHGKYISAHSHLDIIYLLSVLNEDMKKIKVLESENKDVRWFPIDQCYGDEVIPWVRPINEKLVKKLSLK